MIEKLPGCLEINLLRWFYNPVETLVQIRCLEMSWKMGCTLSAIWEAIISKLYSTLTANGNQASRIPLEGIFFETQSPHDRVPVRVSTNNRSSMGVMCKRQDICIPSWLSISALHNLSSHAWKLNHFLVPRLATRYSFSLPLLLSLFLAFSSLHVGADHLFLPCRYAYFFLPDNE